MGFENYGLGWAFVHKEVVAEPVDFVLSESMDFLRKERSMDWTRQIQFAPWRHADFLEKGCSMDWVQRTQFVLVVDGGLQLEIAPQHEGAPRMGFVLRWEDAPQLEVEFSGFEGQS
jgi:hypothetical protein